jgi:hypothetical protein
MGQRHSLHEGKKKYLYIALAIFVLGYLLYKVIIIFTESLFFLPKDRVNIVMYGPVATYYSFDKRGDRHYVMYFPADLKVHVPGGYGNYRIGALGKLAYLDHKPDILKRTFSLVTASFVDYYFYDEKEDVYEGKIVPDDGQAPAVMDILTMKSNANIFDRLYLILVSIKHKDEDFYTIDFSEKKNNIFNDVYFLDKQFAKQSIGLLYQKKYRDEQQSIQLLYDDYNTANYIANMFEGNGIRVNDLSSNLTKNNHCRVINGSESTSQTAKDMSHFFNCPIVKGNTDVYDLIFVPGEKESEWE